MRTLLLICLLLAPLLALACSGGAGWTHLTGDLQALTKLRHRLGAYDPDPVVDADKTRHAGRLVFGCEPRGRWCPIRGLMKPTSIEKLLRRATRL